MKSQTTPSSCVSESNTKPPFTFQCTTSAIPGLHGAVLQVTFSASCCQPLERLLHTCQAEFFPTVVYTGGFRQMLAEWMDRITQLTTDIMPGFKEVENVFFIKGRWIIGKKLWLKNRLNTTWEVSLLLAKETSKMFGSTLTLSKWATKLFNKQVIKIDFKSMLGSTN